MMKITFKVLFGAEIFFMAALLGFAVLYPTWGNTNTLLRCLTLVNSVIGIVGLRMMWIKAHQKSSDEYSLVEKKKLMWWSVFWSTFIYGNTSLLIALTLYPIFYALWNVSPVYILGPLLFVGIGLVVELLCCPILFIAVKMRKDLGLPRPK